MLILIENFIILFTLFSPAHLTHYTLRRADFNMGETVFEQNVQLSCIGDQQYKITSSEGEKTFRMWDFVTMIGSMVEFDTYDSNPSVRCVFDSIATARDLYHSMKPSIHPEMEFPMTSTAIILYNDDEDNPGDFAAEIIHGGKLVVELRNRFHIVSEDDDTIDMIFSCTQFNVSSLLSRGRLLLVVQMYDIEDEQMTMMRFELGFRDVDVARSFQSYVKETPPCTSNIIPVVFPDDFTP